MWLYLVKENIMAQVIIYTNENGGVSVCFPTDELPIEEVLTKDCPEGAMIVDSSILPTDFTYFDAWVLNNGVVTVDDAKKAAIIAKQTAETNTKTSALAKLAALGLTQDEVKALVG
jgi:hypothetical protein